MALATTCCKCGENALLFSADDETLWFKCVKCEHIMKVKKEEFK